MSTKSLALRERPAPAVVQPVHGDRPKSIPFSVDSALLRELGERLVGKPHIALAELVKNSYDADATKVIIRFGHDRIEVIDNGHGMTETEFKHYWMRVGTPHKQEKRFSRNLHRPLTGSKGVGRLAVQFLSRSLELRTVSENERSSQLIATVDWTKAVQAGELTKARALCRISKPDMAIPGDGSGTEIILSNLNQEWTAEQLTELAQEIWWLQPPFRSNPALITDKQKAFEVVLESPNREEVRRFDTQMRAYQDIWQARLVGRLSSQQTDMGSASKVKLFLEFADGTSTRHEYSVPDCKLDSVEYEIRVYKLLYRQPHGLHVDNVRQYFKEFGGVHVYDAGFHLPYYGPDTDWLGIEIDHSHRLSKSKLLPDDLQVAEGMNNLPTNSRLLGVVHVDASKEREMAVARKGNSTSEYLALQVTRDRLVDNRALQSLRNVVRYALDFYAMQVTKRRNEQAQAARPTVPVIKKIEQADERLENYREEIPENVYSSLRAAVRGAISASVAEAEAATQRVALLGPLATAGMCALAYEHEINKQFRMLEDILTQLGDVRTVDAQEQLRLNGLADELREWMYQAKASRALFSYLTDPDNRNVRERLRARSVVEGARSQMAVLLRGIEVETSAIDPSLRLPKGSVAEWSAIFQNVFVNAVNAMLDSTKRLIAVSSRATGPKRALQVQDTGCGVDLSSADELFKPFSRRVQISAERRALGLGGTGLGLTIVRMIADNIGCKVRFVQPTAGFSTAFELSWSEE